MKVATGSKPFSYDNLLLEINANMRLVHRGHCSPLLPAVLESSSSGKEQMNLGNLDYNAVVSLPFLGKVTDSKLTLARAGIRNKGAHTDSHIT
jgi:hypothetical protein